MSSRDEAIKSLKRLFFRYRRTRSAPDVKELRRIINHQQLTEEDRMNVFEAMTDDKSILHIAGRSGHADVVTEVLESVQEENRLKLLEQTPKLWFFSYILLHKRVNTALHEAVMCAAADYGSSAAAQAMMDSLTNPASKIVLVSKQDDRGRTPIDIANEGELKEKLRLAKKPDLAAAYQMHTGTIQRQREHIEQLQRDLENQCDITEKLLDKITALETELEGYKKRDEEYKKKMDIRREQQKQRAIKVGIQPSENQQDIDTNSMSPKQINK